MTSRSIRSRFAVSSQTVAPIVGTARIASATSKIVRALELEVAELEAETKEGA